SSDNCSISSLSIDVSDFTCADLGENTVELTVTDQSGNSASALAIVTVEDTVAPTVSTQNITVQLDITGNASITANQIDNGSSDNCSISSLSIDVSDFTCADLGENTVELTVTDQSGNSVSASATVIVEDTIAPTIDCPADFHINSSGPFTLPDYISENIVLVNDNCSYSVEQTPASGTELPDGNYIISFTVTDSSGNEDSCSFQVTVKDETLGLDDSELLNNHIIIYPNPIKDVFTIKNTSNVELLYLEIYEVSGKLIQIIDLKNMNQTLDVMFTSYSTGVYLLKINAQNTSIVKRLVKK
ncbi:T9SS type A sorting domain-containing protein, partial [Paucihalobacter sp.]|uniref:T9SS type A sorting domain-containing protein n=1 Tax=Paucihalobacter sp. TaxID=2850405 RepID=UPI002FE2EF78